jgi:hypothetical protein
MKKFHFFLIFLLFVTTPSISFSRIPPSNIPNDSQATCVEGDCENGYGKMSYSYGSTYEGEFKEGKRDGKGKNFTSRGEIYIGEWKENSRHGQGIMLSSDGHVSKCIWENGELIKIMTID